MKRSLLVVAIFGAVCYSHLVVSSGTKFVYDDIRFVERNQAVHHLSDLPRFFTDPTLVDPDGWYGIYRPLRSVSFALDWAVAGDSPRYFHLVNLLLHLAGGLLLLLLLRRWGARPAAALLGTLVFVAHPVQVEAVAWISSRGDLLCLVFFLAALLAHQSRRGPRWSVVLAGTFLALALLSKETALVFPGAALLADYFFRDDRLLRRTVRRWPAYLTYLLLAGLYLGVRTYLQVSRSAPLEQTTGWWGGTYGATLLTMSRGFVYYARLLVLPVDMAIDFYIRPVTSPDPLTILCAVLALGVLGAAVWRARHGGGAAAFGILWAAGTLLPAANLLVPIGIPTAERFLYLPLAGLALPIGIALAWTARRGGAARVATIALVGCLGAVTFARTLDWDSNQTLWSAGLRRFESPRSLAFRAEERLAQGARFRSDAGVRLKEGDTAGARVLESRARALLQASLRDFDREMELWRGLPIWSPPYPVVRAGRAMVYYELGRYEEALKDADAVLEHPVRGFCGRAHMARALVFHARGDLREAAREADLALESGSGDTASARRNAAAIYQDLAIWYNRSGEENRARTILALRRSWSLLPSVEANKGVRDALDAIEHQYAGAAAPLRQRLERGEGDPATKLELAILDARFGNFHAAGRLFASLRGPPGTPGDPAILFPYARYFWESRDTLEGYEHAQAVYREIAATDPGFPGVQEALARVARKLASLQAPTGS